MKSRKSFFITGLLFGLFAVFTAAVMFVNVRPIGPAGTSVGLAGLNGFVFALTGVNLIWYHITDWLGVTAILTAAGFAVLGLAQWIRRKGLLKVDHQILALGGFYAAVVGTYVFFEMNIVNYRPVILNTVPEASYPSSHTMIVACIMSAAVMEIRRLFAGRVRLRRMLNCLCMAVIAVTVVGRLVSGVHWFTDIIGGALLSAALIMLYRSVVIWLDERPS